MFVAAISLIMITRTLCQGLLQCCPVDLIPWGHLDIRWGGRGVRRIIGGVLMLRLGEALEGHARVEPEDGIVPQRVP